MRIFISVLLGFVCTTFFFSCEDTPVPKRYSYFRIPFLEKNYQSFDSTCPFTFRYPVYANIERDMDRDGKPCYMNVVFPDYNAKIHLSYLPVTGNQSLYHLTEDAFHFVTEHNVVGEGYSPELVTYKNHNVYGLLYNIKGDVASSTQFFVTDSIQHYIRGALYFNNPPNRDSLQPVIDYIRTDIDTMLNSLQWKDVELPEAKYKIGK